MRFKISDKRFSEIMLYALLLISIYLSGPVNTSVDVLINETVIKSLDISIIVLSLYFVFKVFYVGKNAKEIVLAVIFISAYWILNYIHYNVAAWDLFIHFIWFICFLCVGCYSKKSERDYLKILFNIVYIISVISLAMYVIIRIFPTLLPSTIIRSGNVVYLNYFNFYYELANAKIFGTDITRLQGIFWEPGVYAVYLNMALYYFVFIKSDKKIGQYLLLIISIVLTFSTTGIILAIFFSAVYFANTPSLKKYRWLLIVILGFFAVILSLNVWNQKKAETNFTMMSYSLRMSDLELGINLLLKNPILGVGYNNSSVFTNLQGFGRGNSNGFITWCYNMGFIGLFLLIFPFIKNVFSKGDKQKKFNELVFMMLFIVVNLTEPLILTPIMWFIVAMEYTQVFSERNKV